MKQILVYSFIICAFQMVVYGADSDKGFKLTDKTRLHTTVEVETEFSTNITKASEDTEVQGDSLEAVSDIIMHYKPGLRLKIDDSFKTLGMSILFDYNHYLGVDKGSTTSKFSTLNLSSEVLAELNKDSKIIFSVKNSLDRRSHPNNQTLRGVHSNLHERFDTNIVLRNAQDTLLFKVTPAFDMNFYEDRTIKEYNYMNIKGGLFGRWKFLPKTMVFLNASIVYRNFFESEFSGVVNSFPIAVFAGFAGQITPRFSAKISAGYSATMSENTKHDFIMGSELVYKYSKNLLAKLGYMRSYFPASYFQYYRKDKPYLTAQFRLFGKLLLSLKGSYSYLKFGTDVRTPAQVEFDQTQTPDSRRDHLITVSPSVQYNIFKWLGTGIFYTMNYRASDYKQVYDITDNDGNTYNETRKFNYIEHVILFNVSLDY